MLTLILSLSKTNKIADVHPLEKMVLFISPLLVMSVVENAYWIILLNLVAAVVFHMILKNPKMLVLKFTGGITLFTLMSSITLVFDQDINYIIVLVLKSITGSLYILLFTITTPIDDLFFLASRYRLTRDIADLAKGMMRYLILIEDEVFLIKAAMVSRGGFDTWKGKIINSGRIMGVLFINTIKRWKDISDAVDSRGYRGKTVYLKREFNLSKRRFFLESLYIVCLFIIVWKFDKI